MLPLRFLQQRSGHLACVGPGFGCPSGVYCAMLQCRESGFLSPQFWCPALLSIVMALCRPCMPSNDPPRKRVRRARLRLGTDFSGLEVVCVALDRLGVSYSHVFSCESNKAARALIEHQRRPQHLFKNVKDRDPAREDLSVDLFVLGPPCQPYSKAGKGGRMADERAQVGYHSLDFIMQRRPRVVIFENVPEVVSVAEEEGFFPHMLHVFHCLGYEVEWKFLDTQDRLASL